MPHRRSAFFISDRTGITAESLGHTLLTQFDTLEFKRETLPFIDTVEKAEETARLIRDRAEYDHHKPLVFLSIVDRAVQHALLSIKDHAVVVDFFETFIGAIEQELGMTASRQVGKSHGIGNDEKYGHRIDAVNFSLNHEDGVKPRELDEADVILVGVSRSGKTPTCLYLALQYGIKAANYPLTPDDFGAPTLPKLLLPYRSKLFGLTIQPDRLVQIRSERRPNSHYASLDNCRFEVAEAEAMFRHHRIPYITTTSKSIEEIATTIMHQTHLKRRF